MPWYIDAVAELDELHEQHCASCNAFSGEDCKQCKIGHIVDFLENKYLGDEPTADVVEVRHAHWVKAPCSERDGDANCSYCGNWDWSDKNYCSDCGAKMDGGKNK